MGKHKNVFGEAVSEMKHFLLGAGLVLALVTVVPALAQMGPGGGMGGGGAGVSSGGQQGGQGGMQGSQQGGMQQGGQGGMQGSQQGGMQQGGQGGMQGSQQGGQGGQRGQGQGSQIGGQGGQRGQGQGSQIGGQGGMQGGQGKSYGRGQGQGKGLETAPGQTGEFPEGGGEGKASFGVQKFQFSGSSKSGKSGGEEGAPMPGFKEGEEGVTGGSKFAPMPGFKPSGDESSQKFKQSQFQKARPKLQKQKLEPEKLTKRIDKAVGVLRKIETNFNKKVEKALSKGSEKQALSAVRYLRGKVNPGLCAATQLPPLPLEIEVEEFDCDSFVSDFQDSLDEALEDKDADAGVENGENGLADVIANLEAYKTGIIAAINAFNEQEPEEEEEEFFEPEEEFEF